MRGDAEVRGDVLKLDMQDIPKHRGRRAGHIEGSLTGDALKMKVESKQGQDYRGVSVTCWDT